MKDIVINTIKELEDNLLHDIFCSQELIDILINECIDIEMRGNNFNIIRNEEGFGYILDEFEDFEGEPIETGTYWFEDFR